MWNGIVLHPTIPCRVYCYTSEHLYESSDCGATFTEQKFTKETVGIEPVVTTSFDIVSLYPNPYQSRSGSHISLTVTSHSAQQVSIKVFDLLGREVLDAGKVSISQHETVVPIHVSSLPPGVYIAKCNSGIMSRTEKFLVW